MDRVIEEYEAELRKMGQSYEIIVVVNGVAELPVEKQREIISTEPNKIKVVMRESGWGKAVKAGIAEAQGDYVCYTNTARTFAEELVKVLRYASVRTDTVVKGARLIRENKTRKIISFIYNLENRWLLHTPVLDVNATPKVIPKHLLDGMQLVSDDDLFCAELMNRCYKKNIPIVEIPVKWGARKAGRSTTDIRTAIHLSTALPSLLWKIED